MRAMQGWQGWHSQKILENEDEGVQFSKVYFMIDICLLPFSPMFQFCERLYYARKKCLVCLRRKEIDRWVSNWKLSEMFVLSKSWKESICS